MKSHLEAIEPLLEQIIPLRRALIKNKKSVRGQFCSFELSLIFTESILAEFSLSSNRALLVSNPISIDHDDEIVEIIMPPVFNLSTSLSDDDDDDRHPEVPSPVNPTTNVMSLSTMSASTWRPLLLILPLRLGLHELNMMYAPHLMVSSIPTVLIPG